MDDTCQISHKLKGTLRFAEHESLIGMSNRLVQATELRASANNYVTAVKGANDVI